MPKKRETVPKEGGIIHQKVTTTPVAFFIYAPSSSLKREENSQFYGSMGIFHSTRDPRATIMPVRDGATITQFEGLKFPVWRKQRKLV